MKSELPTFRVNFVKTDINMHELDDFKNFWINKSDCIGIQDLVNIMKPEKENNSNNLKEFKCSQPFNHMTIRYDGSIFHAVLFLEQTSYRKT